MNEVEAPALLRQGQQRRRRSGADIWSAAAPLPDCQAFLTIDTPGLVAVHHHALTVQQEAQMTIAEQAALVGQLA